MLESGSWESSLSAEALGQVRIARSFVRTYVSAREGLTTLGILRSERSLQGDYAEWLAAELLGLTLASSGVQKGFDAVNEAGERFQIKSRLVRSLTQSTSFDFRSEQLAFDYLVAVFFDPEFELLGLARVRKSDVLELGNRNMNGFRFRWKSSLLDDPRVERVVWPKPTPS